MPSNFRVDRFAALAGFELTDMDRAALARVFADFDRALDALEQFAKDVDWPDVPARPVPEVPHGA